MVEPNVRPTLGPQVGHELLPYQTTSLKERPVSAALRPVRVGRFPNMPPLAGGFDSAGSYRPGRGSPCTSHTSGLGNLGCGP